MIKISKATSYTKIRQDNTWKLIGLAFNTGIGGIMLFAVIVLAFRESFFERNILEKLFFAFMAMPGIYFAKSAYYNILYLLERPLLIISPEKIEIKHPFRPAFEILPQTITKIETKEHRLSADADIVIHCFEKTYPVHLILSDEEAHKVAQLLKSFLDNNYNKNIEILDLNNAKSKSETVLEHKDTTSYFECNIVEKKCEYSITEGAGETATTKYYYILWLNGNRRISVSKAVFERAIWGHEIEIEYDKDTDHIINVTSLFRDEVIIKESVLEERKLSKKEKYDCLAHIDKKYKNDYGYLLSYLFWASFPIVGITAIIAQHITILQPFFIHTAIFLIVLIPCIYYYVKFRKKQRAIAAFDKNTIQTENFTVLDKYEDDKKYFIKKDYSRLEIDKSKFDKIDCGDFVEVAKDAGRFELLFINVIEKKQYRNNLQI